MICDECGVAAPGAARLLRALGFPRKLTIDLVALERRYHDLGRKIHPDRFASSAPNVRDASLRAPRF